jgi:hypothetical protein
MSDVGVVLLIALAVLYFLPTAIVGIRDKAEGGFGISSSTCSWAGR